MAVPSLLQVTEYEVQLKDPRAGQTLVAAARLPLPGVRTRVQDAQLPPQPHEHPSPRRQDAPAAATTTPTPVKRQEDLARPPLPPVTIRRSAAPDLARPPCPSSWPATQGMPPPPTPATLHTTASQNNLDSSCDHSSEHDGGGSGLHDL